MRERGFTLIELLVVISIIGLLSSVVLASLNTARAKANNTRRIADLQQLRTALELYYSSNGSYPIQASWRGTTPQCYSTGADGNTAIPGLVPNYISSMPKDPKPVLPSYCYLYMSNGVDYKVLAYSTVEGAAVAPGAPYARYPTGCGGSSQNSYAVYTDGAKCW